MATKRLVDLALSAVALIILAPLLLVIAVIVRRDSAGPALFSQRRIGLNKRPFMMLKFRTMYRNADESVHRQAIARAAKGVRTQASNGKQVFKSLDDPRITPAGNFLRAWCLDELPQVINVLRGDMSLVGPRPAIEYELDHYEDDDLRRFAVRPGITGLWQVKRSTAENLSAMLKMDVEYAASCSLWTDFKLMAMTIPAIVRDRGAY